ncbi:hypothetical protein [Roseovarius sp. 2305UL8-3]|uniref:hypothetical protein n=1 Tax=Roseovarius conchicola TaxID=3121636 RepID=UPI003528DCB7
MSDHRDIKQSFWRKDNPIAYGVTLTAIILFGYLILGLRERCIGSVCETNLWIFWESDPNEIGDTLAGLFSALAFVWIIVTVFLQNHELKEQRKEFRAQREATQDMARALAAQAVIFEDEQSQRAQVRASELLEQKLVRFRVVAGYLFDFARKFPFQELAETAISTDSDGPEHELSIDVQNILHEISLIDPALIDIEFEQNQHLLRRLFENIIELESIVTDVKELQYELSPGQVQSLFNMDFDRISDCILDATSAHFERCLSLGLKV